VANINKKMTPNPIYQAIKQAKADAQMHETGDFFRKAAQVRTLSSEKLRLQLKSTSLEYDIDVDEQIATVISGAFNLYPDKLQASVFSGSGAKYYPVLLAVNAQKHLVMRIETHKINRPYGASIAFADEEIIKKILMGIKNSGIDSGKFEVGHAQTGDESDESEKTPAKQADPKTEAPTVYKFKSGLVMQKSSAEEIVNIAINIILNCRISIGLLHSGKSFHDQNAILNIVTFIDLLEKAVAASPYIGAGHHPKPIETLLSVRKSIVGLVDSKITYRPISYMLKHLAKTVESCRSIVNDLYPQFVPILFESHLYDLRMQLLIRQYAIAVESADKYISTMSLTYWKVAETALSVAEKIKGTFISLPNYASELICSKDESIEDFIDKTKPKLKVAGEYNTLALQTSGAPLGDMAHRLLEIVANLQCGNAAQFSAFIDTAKNQHKALTINNAALAAYLVVAAPETLFEGGSNVNGFTMEGVDAMALAYKSAAVKVGMEELFKMPSPYYLEHTENDQTGMEEHSLNEIGWWMIYAAHSPVSIAKAYAQMIAKKTEWFIEKIGTSSMCPTKGFFPLILDVNEICRRVMTTELDHKQMIFSAIDRALMQLPLVDTNSISLSSTLGVVAADLAYMYLKIIQKTPISPSMLTLVLKHAQDAGKHKKHIMTPLITMIKTILAEMQIATIQNDLIQNRIEDMSEQFLQLLVSPDA